MSEDIMRASDSIPIYPLQDKGFACFGSFYLYIVLTPIDGETLVTPLFYLNGSEETAHLEIKWESEMISVRLVTKYELFYVEPYIKNIIIGQDDRQITEKMVFNRTDMDEELWIKFKRPKFDEPKFIKFMFCFIYDETRKKMSQSIPYKMELRDRLNRLYEDKTYADFKIIVGTEEFLTHKMVLAEKSPVFADMFNRNTNAECENVLIINDIDPIAFKIFLKYLYLSETDDIQKTNINLIVNLIKISITYKVDDFKSKMSKLAMYSLTPENAQQWLQFAIEYNLEYIKNGILFCIVHSMNAGIPNLF